jgi:hypothetical protein
MKKVTAKCRNCEETKSCYQTSKGPFCGGPCMHEFLGWPDCGGQGRGFEMYPLCELHAELDNVVLPE